MPFSLPEIPTSLPRTLEPEIMDTLEDALEYDTIDHAGVNEAFVDYLVKELGFTGGHILDLGTGPGDIPIAIAKRLPHAEVTAVEMGSHMLSLAARKIEAAGLTHRIALRQADAKRTGLPTGGFDLVICNSLAHHIPEPLDLFREIARLCRPGAGVFLKDLRRPPTAREVAQLVERHAANDTPYQRALFHNSLHAALRADEVREIARAAGLGTFSLTTPGDRHWQLSRRLSLGAQNGN